MFTSTKDVLLIFPIILLHINHSFTFQVFLFTMLRTWNQCIMCTGWQVGYGTYHASHECQENCKDGLLY